jgi:hypothetical protein
MDRDHVEVAGLFGEERHVVMGVAAGADSAVAQLARVASCVIDQLGHRLRAEICRCRNQDSRNVDNVGNRHYVLVVVGKFRGREHGRDRIGGHVAQHQRVAVGSGADHLLDGNNAIGARLVLYDHGLPEDLAQLLAEDACHDVGRASGCVGHDDLDRLGRISVLPGRLHDAGCTAPCERQQGDGEADRSHQSFPAPEATDSSRKRAHALIPCRPCEASLQVKNTTSASGVALPE